MADLWCPLCDWTQPSAVGQYQASNAAAAPAVAAAMGLPADALLSMHTRQCMRHDETMLNRHLGSHRLDEWVTALMTARGQVAQIGRIMLDQATEFARFAKLDGSATS